jgi:hypothetical protein
MLPKTIENALANGYTTEGQSYKEIVRGNTLRQTGVWELSGDALEDQLEVPYTAVFQFGKPRRCEVKVEHLATRKVRRLELPIRLVK